MKKFILLFVLLLGFETARADEGMWLLKLMEQQHLVDSLRKAGLKLTPEQLDSDTVHPSLRNVVGIFGNGCTGEIISEQGLVLTNNHCGFGYVHAMSTLEHNYLQDGYFAKAQKEELPVPGLTFTFVRRIDDVTSQVEEKAQKEGVDVYTMQSQSFLEKLAEQLREQSDLRTMKGLRVRLVPFFGGNRFYLFFEQVYQDVRLVANPPQSVAQFGFNSDNWMWPRHNADFAVFRVYADTNGDPVGYRVENKPLVTENFLTISLGGVEEEDYAMVMGFPGRTSRFLTASQIRLRTESQNAPINLVGEVRLSAMKAMMNADSMLNLSLASDYMAQGNMVKNYGGMNESVRQRNLIVQTEAKEKDFQRWAMAQPDHPEYREVIQRIDRVCKAYSDTLYDRYLYSATLGSLNFGGLVRLFDNLEKAVAERDQKRIKDLAESIYKHLPQGENERHLFQMLATKTLPYWFKHKKVTQSPEGYPSSEAVCSALQQVLMKSSFRDSLNVGKFAAKASIKKLHADPLFRLSQALNKTAVPLFDAVTYYNRTILPLNKIYVQALCEKDQWTKAPDANFTLRMTYGHVKGYSPRNGVSYSFQTTLEGMLEKESAKDPDYFIHPRLRQLHSVRNYGRYAREDGKLSTCFVTTNDITGGNSGSPVLNAKGELIGCAFDGNIESLSSDLAYYPEMQRCIAVDIRFVLWTLDIFGEAKYLMKELQIR